VSRLRALKKPTEKSCDGGYDPLH